MPLLQTRLLSRFFFEGLSWLGLQACSAEPKPRRLAPLPSGRVCPSSTGSSRKSLCCVTGRSHPSLM